MSGRSRADAAVGVIVQARMSSSRLRGKVLKDLGPGTTLELLTRRLERLTEADTVLIATSVDESDDPVADAVAALGVPVVRGPLDDVLERYRMAAASVECDAIVRITADCPLAEPVVIDRLVRMWREGDGLAYVWNAREPRTFPAGLDAEVVSRSALEEAAAETRDPYDREHVTPFVRDRPGRFPQQALRLEPPVRAVKLSLDTPEDLATIRSFVERVGPDAGLERILAAAGGGASKMVLD
jgi:spore coat polysaccharide biosynthesis protein SpsF (cytidylyltransferase family)